MRQRWPWLAIIVAVLVVEGLGFFSGQVAGSSENNPWFESLTLPAWQPPGPVFGLAWSLLYALMAVAAALVWATPATPLRRYALTLFALQLVLNLGWSPVFFRYHEIGAAFALLLAVFAAAIATTLVFGRVRPLAAWLMLPYLGWLGYAAVLNFRVWQLNVS